MDIKKIKFKGIDLLKPIIISGPCSAESREQVIKTAQELSSNGIKIFRAGLWKPRTRPGCFEGVGEKGLDWLQDVKKQTNMLIATEVATPTHINQIKQANIDIIWIGARTVTNPFAMQDLADSMKNLDIPVLIKNPVNPDIDLWCGAIERLYNAGIQHIGVIHRGFSSYENKIYRNLPLWHIPIELHRRFPEMTFICDPSHIGGKANLIAPISQQALDLNFDGLIIESHCNPQEALSDANQQITPDLLKRILKDLVIRDNIKSSEYIKILRQQIDEIDENLIVLLSKRMKTSIQIGEYKKDHNMPILQGERYNQILTERGKFADSLNLDRDFICKIMQSIHEESVRIQHSKYKEK